MKWFKGSLHTHTARSDGDINLDGVVHWYASRSYDWVAITDHHIGLEPETAAKLGERHGILVVPGIEVTGVGHVVGLGISDECEQPDFLQPDVRDSLQAGVNWIRDHGGLPILAHPNWGNVYDAGVIARIRDCHHFEVHNASPDCNTFAAGGLPGTDDIWNDALNRGMRLFGVGSDDAHHFLPEKFHSAHATAHGGECATYVACSRLSVKSVLAAIEAGRCVASSGARPVKAGVVRGWYVVEVTDPYPHFHFTTEFIGPNGLVATVHGRSASCAFPRSIAWLRARVFCSSGRYLWTQPAWR